MNGFVSNETARKASEYVYPDSPTVQFKIPPGFQLDDSFGKHGISDKNTDFFAYALKPTADNTSVAPNTRILAMRGTETKSDVYADLTDVAHKQFLSAKDDVNNYLAANIQANNNIELTGHSKGGALVQWTINDHNMEDIYNRQPGNKDKHQATQADLDALASHLHFTTFNSPGITEVPDATPKDKTTPVQGEHHVIALGPRPGKPLIYGDPVHCLGGDHVGGKIVAHMNPYDTMLSHAIKNDGGKWDGNVVANYKVPEIHAADYQKAAQNDLKAMGLDKAPTSEAEAAAKLALVVDVAVKKAEMDGAAHVEKAAVDGVVHVAKAEVHAAGYVAKEVGKGAEHAAQAYATGAQLEAKAMTDGTEALVKVVSDGVKRGAQTVAHTATEAAHFTAATVNKGVQITTDAVHTGLQMGAKAVDAGEKAVKAGADTVSKTVQSGAKAVVEGADALNKEIQAGAQATMAGISKTAHLLTMPDTPSNRITARAPEPVATQGRKANP